MAISSFIRYVCDNESEHVQDSTGDMPAGWIQLVTPFQAGPVYFDTIDCADEWYEQHAPQQA